MSDFQNVNIKGYCGKKDSKNGKSQCFMVKHQDVNKFFWYPKNCVHTAAYSLGFKPDFEVTVYELDEDGNRKNEKTLKAEEFVAFLGEADAIV